MDYINLLSDRILVQVLGNLSPGMTKSCCLVCKRWDSIIGQSSELMGKYILDLTKPFQDVSRMSVKDIQRKHQSISAELKYSLDVIIQHNLKYLKLTGSGTKLSMLIKALNNLTSLKVFDAQYVKFIDDLSESSDSLKKVFTNIEELICLVEVTHIFECCTIKKLSIRCRDETEENWNTMAVDFIKRQELLEDLKISGDPTNAFFTLPDIYNFNFTLKKFKYESDKPFQYHEELIQFLNQHKSSLTSLDLHFTKPQFGIEFVHKFALENIVNLKHLIMGYAAKRNEISFNEITATQITRNLETLSITIQSTDMNVNKKLFDMMPNLKRLKLSMWIEDRDAELLNCICERCPELERLEVSCLDYATCLSEAIHFPKLKELILDFNSDQLCAFINRHSHTLEKIVIKEFDDFTRILARSILNCSNLNHFELNIYKLGLASSIMIHEIILKSKPFTLVLIRQNYKFYFPDDKAIFDAIDDNELDHFYMNL